MSNILAPFQLLELNIISAQDLANVSRSMRTYAVAWVHPDRKLSTRVDTHGDNNPTWNDKFVFRVDEEFLYSDTSAVMIEIYALHWFRDVHVGTVRVLVGNLIPAPPRFRSHHHGNNQPQIGMRFVALQVRRPSGRPQGILNIGVAVLDSSMRSMPLYSHLNAVGYRHLMGEEDSGIQHGTTGSNQTPLSKPSLRRTKSDNSSMIGSELRASELRGGTKGKNGKSSSLVNASEVGPRKKKGRSKASSMISGSDAGKAKRYGKNKKASSLISGSEISRDPPRKGKIGKPSSAISVSEVADDPTPRKGQKNGRNGKPSSVLSGSEVAPPKKVVLNETPVIEIDNWSESEVEKPKVKLEKAGLNLDFGTPRKESTPVHHSRSTPMHPRTTPVHPRSTPVHHRSTPVHHRSTPVHPRATPMRTKSFHKFNGLLEYGTPRRSGAAEYGATPGRKTAILTESELGPSPSEVAAEMAKAPRVDEEGSSVVGGWSLDESVEGLQSKLERWRTELPPVYDRGEFSSIRSSENRRGRRHSDSGNGLFSCFSNICGCECQIVCGGGGPGGGSKKGDSGRVRRSSSADDVSYI
ncbi:uncharacterized protein LOC132180044 [Corylus avellana]|uniref:uncharacterized protein LOC132179955 n=1 Tax=Corylus avellana TaxID=13451 RepID=UPI001E1ED08B|nr:uncharacterized protein LOC132179955 [Corylus avellana]XP_059448873.1 uncharacterized protein LOC132180044 [Corylus avellana]